jgi:hypothetical protein
MDMPRLRRRIFGKTDNKTDNFGDTQACWKGPLTAEMFLALTVDRSSDTGAEAFEERDLSDHRACS